MDKETHGINVSYIIRSEGDEPVSVRIEKFISSTQGTAKFEITLDQADEIIRQLILQVTRARKMLEAVKG